MLKQKTANGGAVATSNSNQATGQVADINTITSTVAAVIDCFFNKSPIHQLTYTAHSIKRKFHDYELYMP